MSRLAIIAPTADFAATKRFGERCHVRDNAIVLESVELAGAAIAALHFIGYPDDTMLVAQRTQLLPIFGRGLDDAAATLNGFQHYDADLRIGDKQALDRVNIAERNLQHIVRELELTAIEWPSVIDSTPLVFPWKEFSA